MLSKLVQAHTVITKKHNSVKAFIAVAPTGSVAFISQAWGDRVYDKEITQKCEFLDKLECRDCVLADRGFNVADDLAVHGVKLFDALVHQRQKPVVKEGS